MVPEIGGHDGRGKAPMGPHRRATRSECAPEASREGRRATADEQHRDWFHYVRAVVNGYVRRMLASLPMHRSASLLSALGEMRMCGSRGGSAAEDRMVAQVSPKSIPVCNGGHFNRPGAQERST